MKASPQKILYDDYTWPEIKEAVQRDPVILLPVGSVEDHGPHLPLDCDNFLIGEMCHAAAQRIPDQVLLMPPIPYGFEDHHMDFPGTISIQPEHLMAFVLDITKSLAHHGFRHILIADGHGSNMPILDLAARKTVLETDALCAVFIWPSLIKETIAELRESDRPGGMSHAAELETSVYLYLRPNRVRMDQAKKEIGFPPSNFIWLDLVDKSPVSMMDWWSRISQTGVIGDPTLATKEKGERFFEAAVSRLVDLIKEFRTMEVRSRTDLHL